MRGPDAPSSPVAEFGPPDVPIENPGAELDWFRQRLSAEGIVPHRDSWVGRAFRAVEEMDEGIAGRWTPPPDEDQHEKIVDAAGMLFLIKAVRRAVERRADAFVGKWVLFRGTDVNLIAYRERTATRDKMWELFVAALCERAYDQVVLAEHENPDVRCSVRGEPWGIECKVLYSRKAAAQQDQLVAKAAQLELAGVSRGIIAVNITALLDHAANIESFRRFPANAGPSRDALNEDLQRQAQSVSDQIDTPQFRRRLFKNDRPGGPRASVRLVLLWSQTLALTDGFLALACNAKWIAYEQITAADEVFIRRFQLAARFGGG